MNDLGTLTAAEIVYRDFRRGRPPATILYFDITLRNFYSEPRWFLLPKMLETWRKPGESGGVTSAEIYDYSGNGHVRVGDFFGNGGFSALLLPGEAEVRLRHYGLKTMETIPAKQTIAIVIADHITINGEDLAMWFDGSALSDATAEVAGDQGEMVSTHNANNSQELPVNMVGTGVLTIEVTIGN